MKPAFLLFFAFIALFVSDVSAAKRHKISLFHLEMSNQAKISYQLTDKHITSNRVSGSLPIFRPGKYKLEVFANNDKASFKMYDAIIDIKANRYIQATLDPARGLSIKSEENFKKNKKEYREFVKNFVIDTFSWKVVDFHLPIHHDSLTGIINKLNEIADPVARVSAAKTAIASVYLTSEQVVSIIGLFPTNEQKVQVAANAFLKTVDTENYILVYEQLTHVYEKHLLHSMITGIQAF